jgi:hypothetical protein
MRLLDAELRRFFARRIVLATILFALALVTVIQVVIGVRARVEDATAFGPPPECIIQDPNGNTLLDESCMKQNRFEKLVVGRSDHRPNIADNYGKALEGSGFAYVLVAVVLGASFLGADFACGAVGTLLLYEPRRLRVLATKAGAAAIGVGIAGLVVFGWLFAAMAINSWLRGVTDGIDGDFFAATAGALARVLYVGALATAVGVAIVAVFRRTAAAVGLLFGFALFEPAILNRWDVLDKVPFVGSFGGVIVGSWTRGDIGGLDSLTEAATVAMLWTAVFLVIGGVVFARREIR